MNNRNQILLWKDRESKRKIYWYLIIQLSMWYNTIHSREEKHKIKIESDFSYGNHYGAHVIDCIIGICIYLEISLEKVSSLRKH